VGADPMQFLFSMLSADLELLQNRRIYFKHLVPGHLKTNTKKF